LCDLALVRIERDETAKAYFDEIIDDFASIKAWDGRKEEGAQFTGRRTAMGASNHCKGRQMTAGGADKSR